jgi:CheY-like chemotaxis protein
MTEAKRRVLVVDDEPTVCLSLAQALAGEAFEVETARSGEEALARTAGTEFALIVCDLMMPGLSGLDLLRSLRGRGDATPVVLITGYPAAKAAEQARLLGAAAFVAKPFTPAEIRAVAAKAAAGAGPHA